VQNTKQPTEKFRPDCCTKLKLYHKPVASPLGFQRVEGKEISHTIEAPPFGAS